MLKYYAETPLSNELLSGGFRLVYRDFGANSNVGNFVFELWDTDTEWEMYVDGSRKEILCLYGALLALVDSDHIIEDAKLYEIPIELTNIFIAARYRVRDYIMEQLEYCGKPTEEHVSIFV